MRPPDRTYASVVPIEDDVSEVIRQCLSAAADDPFFPDWEFSTLFGLDRAVGRDMAEQWPEWDDPVEQSDAVSNAFNHLLGYPHGRLDAWHDYISPDPADVALVFARWRGDTEIDPSGKD